MKIQEGVPTTYLEEFDITVNQYLTYAQIQSIVNNTNEVMRTEKKIKGKTVKCDSWAEKQTNIDMLVLLHATNLTEQELQSPHSMFLQTGIIDAVKKEIKNYNQIEEAFEYTDGIKATILNIITGLTQILKLVDPKTIIKKEE